MNLFQNYVMMPSPIGHIGNQTFWSTFHISHFTSHKSHFTQSRMEAGTLPKKLERITLFTLTRISIKELQA